MNPQTTAETASRDLLEVERLATQDQRRTTVDDHAHFLRCISTDERGLDEIDLMLDEHLQVDPYNGDPPSRRKDKEIANLLGLLDSLEERGDG
jgi:hypothetical protein